MQAAFGLWKGFLLGELCWFTRYSAGEKMTHTQFDYVPTWSWMRISRLDAISIDNARTLPSQIEPLEVLYTAKIITPPVSTLFIQVRKLSKFDNSLRISGLVVSCQAYNYSDILTLRGWALSPTGGHHSAPKYNFFPDLPDSLEENQNLHYLLLKRELQNWEYRSHSLLQIWDFGIVLAEMDGEDSKYFTRVGLY
jgi:hypothetical protein